MLADSFVTSGTCVALVAAVGIHSTRTEHAMKAEALADTPLQKKLFILSKSFTYVGIIASLIILATSIVMLII